MKCTERRKIKFTILEKILLLLTLAALVFGGVFLAVSYESLPQIIAIHFDFAGQADGWGKKGMLWGLFAVQAGLCLFMTVLHVRMVHGDRRFIHMALGDLGAEEQPVTYNARMLVAWLNLETTGMFGWMLYAMVRFGTLRHGGIFTVVTLSVIGLTIVLSVVIKGKEDGSSRKERKRVDSENGVRTVGYPTKKFQGKIDWWGYALVIGANAVLLWEILGPMRGIPASMAICAACLAGIDVLMLPILFRNYVILDEASLCIVFGLIKKRIFYEDVNKVYPTHDPFSSMAFSLDRIYIQSRRAGDVMVAVHEKEAFIREVKLRSGLILESEQEK